MKTVKGSVSANKTLGITPGKTYSITYKGKDETEVVNDFGEKKCYSNDFFIQNTNKLNYGIK